MKKLVVLLFIATIAFAQDDPVARARELARSGNHAAAIALLEERLATNPDDLDARTLYGTVLSWTGDYTRARRELQMVLLRQPDNQDARLALANVERWSRNDDARSEVTFGATYDDFRDSDPWREAQVAIRARTARGPVILRAARARRFDIDDSQIELEAYPSLAERAYMFLNLGYSPDADLYPRTRIGLEYFRGFGRGLEASIGYRRLGFDDVVNLGTASLSAYRGDWLFTLRTYATSDTTAVQGLGRRYLGSARSYVGFRVGRGSSRGEIRSSADVAGLDSTDFAVELAVPLNEKWTVKTEAGRGSGDNQHALVSVQLGRRF